MTLQEHIRKNFTLAWPVMLGQLGHVLVGLADSIMVGQLGTVPLAAGALGNSIFAIPMVFGIGMAMGMTTPIANADGEENKSKAGHYLRHGLLVNIVTALAIFLLVFLFSFFTEHLGQETAVASLATPYLLIITGSIFPLMIFLTFKQFAEGLSDTRFAMYISLGANLLNVFFNYLLIYGNWGFPALGLNGAGYATVIARILMAILMGLYIFRSSKFSGYIYYYRLKIWKKTFFAKLLRIGIPSGLQYIFEISAFALAAIFVGQISAEALAAHQIAISLAALSYMMATGIGAAAAVRVGNQLGAGNFLVMRNAGRSCFAMTLAFMALCGLIFFAGRHFFPDFYTDDPDVIEIASALLVVAVIFQLSDGTQAVALGALRGMSEVRVPTLITLVSYWGFGLLPAYLLGIVFELGPLGVWYGLALGLTAAAVLLYWRFEWKCKKMINAKIRP